MNSSKRFGILCQSGFTYLELIIASMILAILAAAVVPVAQVTAKRAKEAELRRDLRTMRTAIDDYKRAVDLGMIGGTDLELGSEGYPKDLETLVEGVTQVGTPGKKLKFLRRIPVDPMTSSNEWGLRSYQDEPDSTFWGGQNVYDVYSKSTAIALDGTKYSDW
ncbi:MAG TPA: prepilin-type N-terminal cleavage/methylation domain-containing protein [Vicinamibacteria bacterium]|nr:prepilin-type N-terminal cleavage/methylation domain-containing protein [Vicinamibacteria bacterium]